MIKYFLIEIVLLISILGFIGFKDVTQAFAQSTSCSGGNYVWCKRQVSGIAFSGSDVKVNLKAQIQALIAKGDLGPARIVFGEDPFYYAWGNPADVVYALASAYPYYIDDPTFQTNIQTYIKQQLTTYPLWNVGFKQASQGQSPDQYTVTRESVVCNDNRAGNICAPRLWNMYALWLYAESTGDWSYIQNNWSSISTFFNGKNPPSNPNYEDIAGAIGVARMARHIGQPYSAAETLANNLITSGLNYSNFHNNSVARFGLSFEGYQALPLPYTNLDGQGGTGTCQVKSSTAAMNPPILTHLTPEVARYINDNTTLKTSILSYFNKLAGLLPAWMVNKGYWQGCQFTGYHEATTLPPNLVNWMVPTQAWIINGFSNTGDQTRPYVDGPYLPVGDYDNLSNLVMLYEAYGATSWCDVTSGTCITPSPLPSPSPSPSPVPSPTPKPGDINGDGAVGLFDFSIMLTNWGSPDTSSDLNGDGIVGLFDFSLLLTYWGS